MSKYPRLEKRVNRESKKTANFDIPVSKQMGTFISFYNLFRSKSLNNEEEDEKFKA